MKNELLVTYIAFTRDVRGFTKTCEHMIVLPLSLNPPKDESSLMNFIEELWVKRKIAEEGNGPDGEVPEITVLRICRRELR